MDITACMAKLAKHLTTQSWLSTIQIASCLDISYFMSMMVCTKLLNKCIIVFSVRVFIMKFGPSFAAVAVETVTLSDELL